jgi:hypothetical protein
VPRRGGLGTRPRRYWAYFILQLKEKEETLSSAIKPRFFLTA